MKRGKKNLLIGLLASASVAVACFWPPAEPRYQGRSVSEWMMTPSPVPSLWGREVGAERTQAFQAFGTNALPAMIRYLGSKDSASKAQIRKLLFKKLRFRYRPAWLPFIRRHVAVDGFQALGQTARPAVPQLAPMLSDPELASDVLEALHAIGKPADSDAPLLVDKLVPLLGDPEHALRAAWLLGEMGPAAASAVPALVRHLNVPNGSVQWAAFIALGKIGSRLDLTLPALLACLGENNSGEVRVRAILALQAIGTRANAAAPLLREMCRDANSGMAPSIFDDPFISFGSMVVPTITVGDAAKKALAIIDPASAVLTPAVPASLRSTGE